MVSSPCNAFIISHTGMGVDVPISRSIPQYTHPRPHILNIMHSGCHSMATCCRCKLLSGSFGITTQCSHAPGGPAFVLPKKFISLSESVCSDDEKYHVRFTGSAHPGTWYSTPMRRKLDLYSSLEFDDDSDGMDASSLLSSISNEMVRTSSGPRRSYRLSTDPSLTCEDGSPWSPPN